MSKMLEIAIMIILWMIGNFVISKGIRVFTKKSTGIHITFFSAAVKVIWAIFLILAVTGMFPLTASLNTTLLTSSGLLVAIIGFAAQEVLADVISGLMLSWAKPFDIGEKITIESLNISGFVESMNLRHTVIRTYHNSRLIVPNSVINTAVIENSNYDRHFVGSYLEIPISCDSDLEKAYAIMEEVISSHPLVIDVREDKSIGQKVLVLVSSMNENGITLKCTIRTRTLDDNFIACSDIRRQLKKRYDEEGICLSLSRVKIINDSEQEK